MAQTAETCHDCSTLLQFMCVQLKLCNLSLKFMGINTTIEMNFKHPAKCSSTYIVDAGPP